MEGRDVITVATPARIGRPPEFEPETFIKVMEEIIEGKTLNAILAQPGMPSKATFFRWIGADSELKKHYDAALLIRTECFTDEILDTVRDRSEDYKIDLGEPGKDGEAGTPPTIIFSPNSIQRAKLHAETLLKLRADHAAKKYVGAEPERNGDDAKVIGGNREAPKVLEEDPLYGALLAFDETAKQLEDERNKAKQ